MSSSNENASQGGQIDTLPAGEYGGPIGGFVYDPKNFAPPPKLDMDPATAQAIILGRSMPQNIFDPTKLSALSAVAAIEPPPSNTVGGVTSISALATALNKDPQLIFQWVYDNVSYYPINGLHKGALGCLLDGQGTSFDISQLVVELLTAAGITAHYLVGNIHLTGDQAANWLGSVTSPSAVIPNLLSFGQIPNTFTTQSNPDTLLTVDLLHCWVRWLNPKDSIWYVFDASFKQYTYTAGVSNLATIMGYNATTFINDASQGATITSTSVQHLNRTNVRNDLVTYATNLKNWIAANNPTGTVDNILGGRTINQVTIPLLETSLPYQSTGVTPTEYTTLPTNYMVTVRVAIGLANAQGVYPIDLTFTSDQLYGHRLVAVVNAGNTSGTLYLDGTQVATGTDSGGHLGRFRQVITFNAFASTSFNQDGTSFLQDNTTQSTVLLAFSFGQGGRGQLDLHRALQAQNYTQRTDPTSEPVLGEQLATAWAAYSVLLSRSADLIGRMGGAVWLNYVTAGIIFYENDPNKPQVTKLTIVNIPIAPYNTVSLTGNTVEGAAEAISMYSGTWEGLAFADSLGTDTIHVPRIFDIAIQNGDSILLQSGFSYKPSGAVYTYDQFGGNGEWDHTSATGWAHILTVGAKGGAPAQFNPLKPVKHQQPCGAGGPTPGAGGSTGGNPLTPGLQGKGGCSACSFEYSHTDMKVGSQGFPYALDFGRYYSSCDALVDGPLGRGWTHNYAISVQQVTDVLRAMGSDSPIDAIATIVSHFIHMDLRSQTTSPAPVAQIATIGVMSTWFTEQVTASGVAVSFPGEDVIFLQLADGTYQPPAGVAATLTKNGDGTFTYTTAQKVKLNFNSAGQIATWQDPSGSQITFTYTSGQLTQVANNNGRTLTISYASNGTDIASVSDGNGRSVSYSVNTTTRNLDSFTDANSYATTYGYDSSNPGRLTQLFLPTAPTTAALTNTYDASGELIQQANAKGEKWKQTCAGSYITRTDPAGNIQKLYLNSFAAVVQYIDALGEITNYSYDGLQRLTGIIYPEGNSVAFTYDGNNNVLTVTNTPKAGSGLNPFTITYTWDPTWNKVKTIKDALGNISTYNYDPTTGVLLNVQGPQVNGQTPEVQMTYNARGQVMLFTDETGIVTQYNYDTTTERLLSVVEDFGTSPHLNLITQYGYNAWGDVNSITDPRNNASTFVFDNERQQTQATDPAPFSYVAKWTYDKIGKLLTLSRQTDTPNSPQLTQFSYTATDKPFQTTDAQGYISEFDYDTSDRLSKIVDGELRTTTITYDKLNRISTISLGGVVVETRTYSKNGYLATVKDANGNVTKFTRDGFDRPSKTTYPDNTFEQWTYDNNSNVLHFRTRKGDVSVSTYDPLDRLNTQTPGTLPKRTLHYDLSGRLMSVSTPVVAGDPTSGTFQYGYDTAGRYKSEQYPDGKQVSYMLDPNGNVTQVTYPDGFFVNRDYDQMDRLSTVRLNGSSTAVATLAYDSLSRVKSVTRSNSTVTSYGFYANDDLQTLEHQFNGPSVTYTYTRNKASQITNLAVSDGTYLWHPGAGGTVTYGTPNKLNQYPSVGGATYQYDSDGDLQNNGVLTLGYDLLSRLTSGQSASAALSFSYDPFDRQTLKTVTNPSASNTRFIYDGSQRAADYDENAGSLLTRYIYAGSIDEPLLVVAADGTETFYHQDHLGSLTTVTDASGNVLAKHSYGPYGESSSLTSSGFGFTGQRYDAELGLYYFQARYYDPATGRFVQPDVIGYTDSLNLYEYAVSDPLNVLDPSGSSSDGPVFNLRATYWKGIDDLETQIILADQANRRRKRCQASIQGPLVATSDVPGNDLGTPPNPGN